MCRWLAYIGSPVYRPAHSLVVQSMHSALGAEPINGDGFGLGWYTDRPVPGGVPQRRASVDDRNLKELAVHTTSRCVLAHIRASTGSPPAVAVDGLRGAWSEVPESTRVMIREGQQDQIPFMPAALQPAG